MDDNLESYEENKVRERIIKETVEWLKHNSGYKRLCKGSRLSERNYVFIDFVANLSPNTYLLFFLPLTCLSPISQYYI